MIIFLLSESKDIRQENKCIFQDMSLSHTLPWKLIVEVKREMLLKIRQEFPLHLEEGGPLLFLTLVRVPNPRRAGHTINKKARKIP